MTSTSNYNPNTPNINDSFADWQVNFLNNFIKLFSAFGKNHVPMDQANAGNHTIIQLIEQETAQQTGISEISIYTKNVKGQTDQLFMKLQDNITEFQISTYQIYSIPETSKQSFFFTFLPGNVLIYFGNIIASGKTFELILLPPVAKNLITMNFCPNTLGPGDYAPWVTAQAFHDGTYKTITLNSGNPFFDIPRLFYIIAANI